MILRGCGDWILVETEQTSRSSGIISKADNKGKCLSTSKEYEYLVGNTVYFDNTGGVINDAIMENLSLNARIAICGVVSLADKIGKPDIGRRYFRQILVARARVQGFLVVDFIDCYPEARSHIRNLISDSNFKFKEDIADGIESMASSFIQLLKSQNFGKKLIKI